MSRAVVKIHGCSHFSNFKISLLFYAHGKFDSKPIDSGLFHGIGLAKLYGVSRFPGVPLLIINRNGDRHYYNPWYMKWFVNLTDKQLDLYFSRLKPV